jgi:TFIIF-interacting CTD phosphatase-like protein
MAASRAAVQTALHSIKGLRRRRLGHIGPNHFDSSVDKWGRKKANGASTNLLAAGGKRIPVPRASLVLGGDEQMNSSRNGVDAQANSNQHVNGGMNGRDQRASSPSRSYANGTSSDNINGSTSASQQKDINGENEGKDKSSLIVVLDMDECLIHSQFLSDQTHDKYRQDEERPTGKSPFHYSNEEAESIITTTCESFRISLPDGDLVHINKRPNLDLFLKEITSKFETYIFTAAMEVYASPVLDKLDPEGDFFRGRFYREHCLFHEDLGVYAKDLCDVLRHRKAIINTASEPDGDGKPWMDDDGMLHCDERRVVLVDNNPLSFLPNPSNGILVSSFYDDPKDDTLEAVMELLNELDESEDVRPILHEKFGLKDALSDVVKGTSGWR